MGVMGVKPVLARNLWVLDGCGKSFCRTSPSVGKSSGKYI